MKLQGLKTTIRVKCNSMVKKKEVLVVSISKEVIAKDLEFLHKDLERQLKDLKVKEFWDKTLGETCKRISKPKEVTQ